MIDFVPILRQSDPATTSFVLLGYSRFSQNVVVLATIFGTFIVAYVVASAVISLFLHPLADIPGPKLCAISRIPYWLAAIQGKDVFWIHELHIKYGSVVRFGPTDLSYTTAEAWKDIHGHTKGRLENKKATEFSVQPVNGVPSMLTAAYDDHARVRHIFSPAFSDRALKKQEPLFRKYAEMLMSQINTLGTGGKPVDMTRLFNCATFDTMADLCFGHSLGLLERNELSPWVRSIFESLKMLPFVSIINYYPLITSIFNLLEPKWIVAQREVHCRHSADRVNQRLREGSDQPDIWNLVMSADDEGNALSLEEMHSNAELFMLAGSETTATCLTGLIFYLLSCPEKWKVLSNELRSRFRRAEDMTFDKLAECKYLNACLKEGLRIYPPVPIGSPRIIAAGGQNIIGKWIPSNTRVSVHHYSTYHSAQNFRDPNNFVPERWIGNAHYADDTLDAHQPFALGPRDCLGQNMAMHEMRLLLASVILPFDLQLCDESRNWLDQQAFLLWSKNPLMCRVVLRDIEAK